MIKICFLGLTGSGKTCYLYAASHVLSEGIQTDFGNVSILSTSVNRNIELNRGIEAMASGEDATWPKGSDRTNVFPYDLYIGGHRRADFEIYDYRGGSLDDDTDNGQDERDELYETFENSECVVVFIDALTLMKAFSLKNEAEQTLEYRKAGRIEESVLKAKNKLNHLKLIITEACQHVRQDVPILLTITKKDILSNDELNAGIENLKYFMGILFSVDSNVTVGITAVSLGRDLASEEVNLGSRRLTGYLHLDVSRNIHIPILFPLFVGMENLEPNEKRIAQRIFNSNVIQLYRGGQIVVPMW